MSYYKKTNKFENFKTELEMIVINQVLYELQKVIHIKNSKLAVRIIDEFYNYLNDQFPDWRNNQYYRTQKSQQSFKQKLRGSIYESKQCLKLYYKFKS